MTDKQLNATVYGLLSVYLMMAVAILAKETIWLMYH